MREVIIVPWCDGHDDIKVEATVERTISIDGCKPVLLDLCDQCDKDVIIVSELMSRGVLAENPKRKPRKPKVQQFEGADEPYPFVGGEDPKTTTICRICGHDSPTRSALGAHVKTKHSMGLKEMFAS